MASKFPWRILVPTGRTKDEYATGIVCLNKNVSSGSWCSRFRQCSYFSEPHISSLHFQVSANTENSSMSGYLHRSKGNKKPWKRLWFVIKNKVLYTYAASEVCYSCLFIILLGHLLFSGLYVKHECDGFSWQELARVDCVCSRMLRMLQHWRASHYWDFSCEKKSLDLHRNCSLNSITKTHCTISSEQMTSLQLRGTHTYTGIISTWPFKKCKSLFSTV